MLLSKHSRDILAIYAIHMLEFYMGWSCRMKETIANISDYWNDDTPLYGFLKGLEAFALEENADFTSAYSAATEALKQNSRDIYALHAVCHADYETGRYREGIAWMDERRDDWSRNRYMRIHVWWHYAVFHLYQMDFDRVLDIYHSEIRRKNDLYGCEDLDAVGLLWRLSLIGVDIADLWQDVAAHWTPNIGISSYWFNDIHALMAVLGAKQTTLADRMLRQVLTRYADRSDVAAGMTAVCNGLIAFSRGEYARSFDLLSGIIGSSSAIGGSNAQRDLFELTAIEAGLRCGYIERARALIVSGRSLRHPSPMRDHFLTRAELVPQHAYCS